jgi:hypothetical protein
MARKAKFTPVQIKRHIKNIQEAMEKQRRGHERKGRRFITITPEEIEKKLKRINSPMITSQAFNPTVNPGGTLVYSLSIYNPDPTETYDLYTQVWVGSGNPDPTIGTYLLNVDTRFPRLTQPSGFGGLQVFSGDSGHFDFSFQIPNVVDRTTYFLQSCLMEVNWWNVGKYLDRSMIAFDVT